MDPVLRHYADLYQHGELRLRLPSSQATRFALDRILYPITLYHPQPLAHNPMRDCQACWSTEMKDELCEDAVFLTKTL